MRNLKRLLIAVAVLLVPALLIWYGLVALLVFRAD